MEKHRSIWKRTTFFGAIFAGAILVSYLVVNWPVVVQQAQFATGNMPNPPIFATEDVIEIPEIGVRAPIVWATDDNKDALQKQLLDGVVHYPETALPGEIGNGVYVGHSSNYWWEKSDYNTIFGLISKLEAGTEITIRYQDQEYVYEVYENRSVAKDDPEIWRQTDTAEITLVTCWPRGTNLKNFLVRDKLQ